MATLQVGEIYKMLRARIEQYNRKAGIKNIGPTYRCLWYFCGYLFCTYHVGHTRSLCLISFRTPCRDAVTTLFVLLQPKH
jgi:hypothetical protein